jgi:hypothetical protein
MGELRSGLQNIAGKKTWDVAVWRSPTAHSEMKDTPDAHTSYISHGNLVAEDVKTSLQVSVLLLLRRVKVS